MSSLYVVMGVSGCGKSTVASELAAQKGGIYLDADDFHPAANKAKMAAGIPLQDEDRWGWLEALNAELKKRKAAGEIVFLACSALKQVYRDRLRDGLPELTFIFLKGSRECLARRMAARQNHFMPASLLDSQLATLEEPTDAITVDIDQSPAAVLAEVLRQLP